MKTKAGKLFLAWIFLFIEALPLYAMDEVMQFFEEEAEIVTASRRH